MKFKHLILLAAFMGSAAMAHDHQAATASHTMPDAQAIEHNMKKLFDKPDAPLAVAPVIIEGDYAMAGWIQSGKGGRALLKKEKGQWSIQVCGGDGLKKVSALSQTGMPSATAERLVAKVQTAEAKLSADQLKKLSMFDGIVKVEPATHGAHGAHAAHPKH
jgi:curli biogenesis system outer membrane secretion channel CsgG